MGRGPIIDPRARIAGKQPRRGRSVHSRQCHPRPAGPSGLKMRASAQWLTLAWTWWTLLVKRRMFSIGPIIWQSRCDGSYSRSRASEGSASRTLQALSCQPALPGRQSVPIPAISSTEPKPTRLAKAIRSGSYPVRNPTRLVDLPILLCFSGCSQENTMHLGWWTQRADGASPAACWSGVGCGNGGPVVTRPACWYAPVKCL